MSAVSVFVFDNVLEVMNKFEEYKSETQSKWRKIETRGPLFLQPGPDTYETIQHLTLRSSNQTRFLNWAPLRSLNDHTPYVTIGRHIYSCFYGPDPSRPRKLKNLEKELENMSEDEKKIIFEERKNFLGMADVQCPAKVRIMYVIKFPTLKTHIHEKRRSMTHLLDDIMRTNPSELVIKHTYVIELPHDSSHSEHPYPDLNISSNNKTGDRAMNDAIQWYMRGRVADGHVIISNDEHSNADDNSSEDKDFSTSMSHTVEELAQQIMSENMSAASTPKIPNGLPNITCPRNDHNSSFVPVNTIKDRQLYNESIVSTSTPPPLTPRHDIKEIAELSSVTRSQMNEQHWSKSTVNNANDPDEFFLLSLLPQFKTLSPRKASEVRIEFLKVLHKAQFES